MSFGPLLPLFGVLTTYVVIASGTGFLTTLFQSLVCCIVACLAGLLPRTLAWWVRVHALRLGDTVWPLGSTVRRSLLVVGKSDLTTSLAQHAVSRPGR